MGVAAGRGAGLLCMDCCDTPGLDGACTPLPCGPQCTLPFPVHRETARPGSQGRTAHSLVVDSHSSYEFVTSFPKQVVFVVLDLPG